MSRHPPAGGIFHRFLDCLHEAVIEPVTARLRRRAGQQALLALDDHLLADIGLSRSEIRAAAYGMLDIAVRDASVGPPARDRSMRSPSASVGDRPSGTRQPISGAAL